jgi:hypothetical protein
MALKSKQIPATPLVAGIFFSYLFTDYIMLVLSIDSLTDS